MINVHPTAVLYFLGGGVYLRALWTGCPFFQSLGFEAGMLWAR